MFLFYTGTLLFSSELVAIKMESCRSQHPQLAYEYKLYKILAGGTGVPEVKFFGREGEWNVLVMELLGASLEELFSFCSRKFSLKTVLMVGEQLVWK